MGADSYYAPINALTVTPTCRLCGWIGAPISESGIRNVTDLARSAFYGHFHASCIINAAAGNYDDEDEGEGFCGPRAAAALRVLETLSKPCPTCDHRNGWCDHRQPPLRHVDIQYAWARPVPDWAR